MKIEADRVRILSGIRLGETLGSPVTLLVENRDHSNWRPLMQPEHLEGYEPEHVTIPRPGHADLAGMAKLDRADARDVLERSSARETVGRVAAGSLARMLLRECGVEVAGFVRSIGGIEVSADYDLTSPSEVDWEAVETSECACPDREADAAMRAAIDAARVAGESLGGVFEIWAWGACPGVGGFGVPADRLDGRLMGAVGSIPAVKAVEVGRGFAVAAMKGSEVHDEILLGDGAHGLERHTNRAGGLEGGLTNGMPIVIRAAMKPIPTLSTPLRSVDTKDATPADAHRERSDIEAVAAARVVAEAMVALELADAYLSKFGGDSMGDLLQAVTHYENRLAERGLWRRS
jgi:chorismate synthase